MIRQLMKYVHFLRKKFPHMEGVYLAYRDSRYRAMGKGKCVKCLVNGFSLTFELDPKDMGLSSELASEKIHEPLTMQLLTDIIKPGWTVVDIGSHLGYFPLFEACLVEPGGKVIAIEPSVASYNLLVRNIERNNCTKIIDTYNVAVGSKRENRPFYVNKLSNQSSFYPSERAIGVIEVESYPLDELLQVGSRVDAIRMDIEGGEYEAIHGMMEHLKRHHPVLFIELHPSPKMKPFLILLKDLGYECQYFVERRKNTSFLGGRMTNPKDIEKHQITDLIQMKETEDVFAAVLT